MRSAGSIRGRKKSRNTVFAVADTSHLSTSTCASFISICLPHLPFEDGPSELGGKSKYLFLFYILVGT